MRTRFHAKNAARCLCTFKSQPQDGPYTSSVKIAPKIIARPSRVCGIITRKPHSDMYRRDSVLKNTMAATGISAAVLPTTVITSELITASTFAVTSLMPFCRRIGS